VYLRVKRLMDIVIALSSLIILSPILLLIVIGIKLNSKGPVLFKQRRIGIHKSTFHILKFRTMRTDAPRDMPTHLLQSPEQHITKIGKFLRRTSLDELPQIWNVLTGCMSLVGPRPALWNQYDLMFEREKYGANAVRPGMTGWAQVKGRDELPIEVKAKFDGENIRNMGLLMGVRWLFLTIIAVVKGDGIVEGGGQDRRFTNST